MVVRIKNNVILACGDYAILCDKDDKVEIESNVIMNPYASIKGIRARIRLWALRFLLSKELRLCRTQIQDFQAAIKINGG